MKDDLERATGAADAAKCREALSQIAAEAWRLDRVVEKALTRMEPRDAERFSGQYRWFQKKVDAALLQAGLTIVDLSGQMYSVGLAVTPLNADEFGDEPLEVAQMVEPIIMSGGEVMKPGTVMLRPLRDED